MSPRRRWARTSLAGALIGLLAGGIPFARLPGQLSADSTLMLRQRAGDLRRAQRLEEALGIYRRLVAADSATFEERFWVAKLTGWTGQPAQAESLFTALLMENPGDYDTRIGLIEVRIRLGRYSAAREDLEALSRAYPNDPEILYRQGRLEEAVGDRRQARRRFSEALAIRPDHGEVREALRRVAIDGRWVSGLEYYGEHISGAPATSGTTAFVQGWPAERLRWRAESSLQEKFTRTEWRVGSELSRQLSGGTELRASAQVAPGAEVLPRQSYGIGVTQRVGRLLVHGNYGLLDFADATVHRVGPRLELYAGSRWLLSAQYVFVRTTNPGASGGVSNHGGSVAVGYLYGEGNLLRISGAVGGESFTLPSIDVTGAFRAHTIAADWRHFVSPWLGIALSYAYQARSDEVTQHSYGVGLVRRW
jgi:YaiO family outer membrane protein